MSESVAEQVATSEEAPPVEASDDSLAAHEAQYGNSRPAPAVESVETPEPPKHRAKSQSARASDYEDIAKYTKILRETEQEIDGFSIEQLPGESDRVFNLRKRVEITKLAKERRAAEAPPAPKPVAAAPVPQPTTISAQSAFTEAEPTIEQFQDKPDPYQAWTRALAAYDRKKEAFEAQQEAAKKSNAAEQERIRAAQESREREVSEAYAARVAEFVKKTAPDFHQVVGAADRPIPMLLVEALRTADNGPQLVYTLAKQPRLQDEAFLLTDGKAITEQAVASTQRWLTQHATPVGTTGATAGASKPITASRPPTPVRTVPTVAGDTLPGDDSSLAEHEKAFGPRRRRH